MKRGIYCKSNRAVLIDMAVAARGNTSLKVAGKTVHMWNKPGLKAELLLTLLTTCLKRWTVSHECSKKHIFTIL